MKKIPKTELQRIVKAGQTIFTIIGFILISFLFYVYFFL